MNFPTAAGEVETPKFQLSIVYHLLLFSVSVSRLPRSRFLASAAAMLSKDSTRTELGKRPIPTRRQGDNLNTITYRTSLLSRKPNSYHRGNRKNKREDNLVSHSLLLFGYSGNIQVASSPGWDRHRTTRPEPRCVPLSFFFTSPYCTWQGIATRAKQQEKVGLLSRMSSPCTWLYDLGSLTSKQKRCSLLKLLLVKHHLAWGWSLSSHHRWCRRAFKKTSAVHLRRPVRTPPFRRRGLRLRQQASSFDSRSSKATLFPSRTSRPKKISKLLSSIIVEPHGCYA